MGLKEIPDKIKRKIEAFKVWLHNGSEEARIVVKMDHLISELDNWVSDSCQEWKNQSVPRNNLEEQISQFQIFLDVKLQEKLSKIENSIEKNKRELNGKRYPEYHDNLVESMEETIQNFNTERTRLRNALRNAEDDLDKNNTPSRVEANLAEIEEREEDRVDEMQNNIKNMRKICVRNNLVRSLKIDRMLP